MNGHHHFKRFLTGFWFTQGRAFPRICQHPQRMLRLLVRGGGYVASGHEGDLTRFRDDMSKQYECKLNVLVPGACQENHVKIFDKILTWQPECGGEMVVYEANLGWTMPSHPAHIRPMMR